MSWLRNRVRLAHETVFQRHAGMVAFRRPGSLRQRLAAGRWLMHYLRWEEPDGTQLPYTRWTEARRAKLDECYENLVHARAYTHAPLDRATNLDWSGRVQAPAAQAFDLYAGQVAHVLYLEAYGKVPWSLADMDEVELLELLSSDRYFSRIVPAGYQSGTNYPAHIEAGRDYHVTYDSDGQVFDPRVGYDFLRGTTSTSGIDHLGENARATLVNLTQWIKDTVQHGSITTDNADRNDWFQLEDRLRRRANPDDPGGPPVITRDRWGCHSTANLLHDVARCINLPLVRIVTRFNATPTSGFHLGLVFFDGHEPASAASSSLPVGGRPGPLTDLTDWWRRSRTRSTLLGWLGLLTPTQRRRAHVLAHADDIYAMGLSPFFPVRPDGTAMTADEKRAHFFAITWVPRQELARWGYVLPEHYDLDTESTPLYDLPNRAVAGGHWPEYSFFQSYLFERFMLAGSKMEFLEYHDYPHLLTNRYNLWRTAASSPLATYTSRFNACLAAGGGWAAIDQLLTQEWTNRQTSVLADAP